MKPSIGLITSNEYVSVTNAIERAGRIDRHNIKHLKYSTVTTLYAEDFQLHVLHSAIGEIGAAAATRALIDFCEPQLIINFGMARVLSNKVSPLKTYIVKNVIHYDFDVSGALSKPDPGAYPQYRSHLIPTSQSLIESLGELVDEFPLVTCASGDKFITKKEDKARLLSTFSADIYDMNSAGTLIVCDDADIPCIIIKGTTDGIHNGTSSFDFSFDRDANDAFRNAMRIIKRLAQNL